MKLGIMQPYLFPYLGYFQLVAAVDKFIFLDDVNFIKRGWINRNATLVAGKQHVFTVPLRDVSQFVFIRDTMVDERLYARWREKFLKTMRQSYKKAPNYKAVYELVEGVFGCFEPTISHLAIASVRTVASYLGLRTAFESSAAYENRALRAGERLLDICRQERAHTYYNAIGGTSLYSKKRFAEAGVALSFIESKDVQYRQFGEEFVPFLSIIDTMMFNHKEVVQGFLNEYRLV
jgi:hypothetical protein